MAARQSSKRTAGRLAVVLTGTAARAAAHLGALQALEDAGLKPEVIVGVSGGALSGALYAASDSAAAARDALYACVANHSWQDLADLDFDSVSNLLTRPHEISGLLTGEALHQGLLAGPIGHQGFQHLARELFVLATDLNSGREVVFGNQSRDATPAPYQLFAATPADLERVNVATAVRASAAAPGLFRPVSLDHYALVDGTLRQRRALSVAAAQPNVTRILWLHAGLDENDQFSLVTDYAGQGLAAVLLQALTVAATDQLDPFTADPALDGKAVRFVNLAVSSIGAAELLKTQQVYESGRRSLGALLARDVMADGGLFTAPVDAVRDSLEAEVDEVDGARWAVKVGGAVLAATDLRPPVQQEFGYEFEEYLQREGQAKLAAKEPVATADWATGLAEAKLGLGQLTWLFLSQGLTHGWKYLGSGLRTAWQALSLDKAVDKAGDAVAAQALWLGDTLGNKDPGAPSAGESA